MTSIALNLVNSIWFIQNGRQEILRDKSWIEANLSLQAISNWTFDQTASDELIALRTLMTEVLIQGCLAPFSENLERNLTRAHYVPTVLSDTSPVNLDWTCISPGQDQLISELTQDLIALFSEKKIEHLKRCSNEECQYYFIDYSKNKSKKYCSPKCGNLMKVRRFRAKS